MSVRTTASNVTCQGKPSGAKCRGARCCLLRQEVTEGWADLLRTRFGQVTSSQLECLHQPFQRRRGRCGRTIEVHHKASVSAAHKGHEVVTMRYLHGEGIVLVGIVAEECLRFLLVLWHDANVPFSGSRTRCSVSRLQTISPQYPLRFSIPKLVLRDAGQSLRQRWHRPPPTGVLRRAAARSGYPPGHSSATAGQPCGDHTAHRSAGTPRAHRYRSTHRLS